MNKKYVLQKDDCRVFCILDGEKPLQEELERVFGIEKGYGLTAELEHNTVVVKNYFRADTLASFPVLAVEDTDQAPVYQLLPL